jgi:hypothetical protein
VNEKRGVTEQEYIAQLEPGYLLGQHPTDATLALADKAVQEFPNSSALWMIRGKLYWGAEFEVVSGERIAAESWEKVIELNPMCAEAHELLAGYHDGIRDDPQRAMVCHEQAEKLRKLASGGKGTPN